jgi:tRNA modification GTPase
MRQLQARCLTVGARVAAPGEFTLRAFLNGKLDLAQAESVADLVDATTAQAARCAARSLQGAFSEAVHSLVKGLLDLRMEVEAALDFPEDDLPAPRQAGVRAALDGLRVRLDAVFRAARQGSLLREGVSVVLIGRPNVGKSSLMNALVGRETAIVTEIPGTTRDAIRDTIDLEGIPFHLIDTAGLRETDDPVEKIGIARTRAAVAAADLALLLLDCRTGETPEDRAIVESLPPALRVVRVYNKIDLLDGALALHDDGIGTSVRLSAKTGAGVDLLRGKLLELAGWDGPESDGLFLARQRHLEALAMAEGYLRSAAALTDEESQLDLLAEDLRAAQQALSSITGEFTADDLLGEIFSRFCIGK